MSMSTHVIGFKPPDDKWQQMKAVWDACKLANVVLPIEVMNFFDGIAPDLSGVEIDLDDLLVEWHGRDADGYEIELSKLPKDVKVIRFYNSW